MRRSTKPRREAVIVVVAEKEARVNGVETEAFLDRAGMSIGPRAVCYGVR